MTLEGVRRSLRITGLMVGASLHVAGRRAFALLGLTVFRALSVPVSAYAAKLVIDTLGVTPQAVFGVAALYLGLLVLDGLSRGVYSVLTFDVGDRVSQHFEHEMLGIGLRSAGVEHMERQDFADKVQGVQSQVHIPSGVMSEIQRFTHVTAGLVGSVVLLTSIHPTLLLVPAIVAPGLVWHYRIQKHMAAHYFDVAADQRLENEYLEMGTGPAGAKEVRVFGLEALIEDRYLKVSERSMRVLFRDHLRSSVASGASGLLQGVAVGVGILWLIRLAATGRATPGDVVMGFLLVRNAIGAVADSVSMFATFGRLAAMGEGYLWLLDYRSPVQSPPRGEAVVRPEVRSGIRLEGVTFRYPGDDTDILQDVTLDIPAGTTIAIVGENGAGKTTLVKLLFRFYDPTHGRITVDGVDLREADLDAWRASTTAVFQDFQSYLLAARESIGLGHLPCIEDHEWVAGAARRGGADGVIEALPHGLETQLGAVFPGGIELSTGQWQRVALARGCMRDAPGLVVLDEPTSSLDARVEAEVFRRFVQMARPADGMKPITVLVSHRFSTVRMADVVVVLDQGRVAEHGSHEELMALGGMYADLYTLQAAAYR